ENLELARITVEARTGQDIGDLRFRASRGEHERVDLSFSSSKTGGRDESSAFNAAFVAIESLLGEQCLNTWIGAIEVVPAPRTKGLGSLSGRSAAAQSHYLALDRLPDTVHAVIGSMRDQLPPDPHCDWIEGAEWTLWQLKPNQADDYCEQHDLFVAKSVNP